MDPIEQRIRESYARVSREGANVSLDYNLLTVEETRFLLEQLDEARNFATAWEKSASDFSRAADCYRGLVVKCGEALGPDAYTSDDGSVQQDVLCAKVPELVEQQAERIFAKRTTYATEAERIRWTEALAEKLDFHTPDEMEPARAITEAVAAYCADAAARRSR